jgi:hypothetical protein
VKVRRALGLPPPDVFVLVFPSLLYELRVIQHLSSIRLRMMEAARVEVQRFTTFGGRNSRPMPAWRQRRRACAVGGS